MNITNHTNIQDYSYELPDEKIPKHPVKERDTSKILIYNKGILRDETFVNCTKYLQKNTLLVFNNTRVIHARIIMQKLTGARIEIFCLEPHIPSNYELIFEEKQTCSWYCIIGNAKKWKDEPLNYDLQIHGEIVHFTATKKESKNDSYIIEFSWDKPYSFGEIIDTIGKIPIPPYLNRESDENDNIQYQTIYAKHHGSVAAPTAGLHFTERVLKSCEENEIFTEHVTLHVGAGTFKPVKTDNYKEHIMHHEFFIVSKELIEKILSNLHTITAVGTTSVRTLESLYWLGVKHMQNPDSLIEELQQWEPYSLPQNITVQDSLTNLLEYMHKNKCKEFRAYTQIMIVPGYSFRIVQAMFTNFHQPQSTLLLLIGAFIGKDWKKIYEHALHNNYRFLSYGDSSLLIP